MIKHAEFANPVLSEAEARSLLSPHFGPLVKCVRDAWAQWESYPHRHALDARARAAFMSAFFSHRARAVFPDFSDSGNTFFLYFGNEAKLRLKKLKSNGTYSNIMTGRQLRLLRQMNIPGILPGTYLTLGYQLDFSEQSIAHIGVTLQSGKQVVYRIDLDEASSASSATPVFPQTPVAPSASPRVKPRKSVEVKRPERHQK